MLHFKPTRLISSLAASALITMVAFVPLPSFLASGTVYAHNITSPRVEMSGHARLNLFTAGHNGIDVLIKYQCLPAVSAVATPNIDVTVQQNADQTGSGVQASGENALNPIICDGDEHTVAVTVTPNSGPPLGSIANGSFNVNKATITAVLTDPSNVSVSATQNVKVEI